MGESLLWGCRQVPLSLQPQPLHYNCQTALRREFLNIQKIQKEEALEVEHTGDSSPMFTSNHDYRDAVRSHTAGHHNSQKIMTTNQSYGKKRSNDDSEGIPQHKIRAKKSCDETRYQSELIKSGFIYWLGHKRKHASNPSPLTPKEHSAMQFPRLMLVLPQLVLIRYIPLVTQLSPPFQCSLKHRHSDLNLH